MPIRWDYGKILRIKTLKQLLICPQTNFYLTFFFHCYLDYSVRGALGSASPTAYILLSLDDIWVLLFWFFFPCMVEEAWKEIFLLFFMKGSYILNLQEFFLVRNPPISMQCNFLLPNKIMTNFIPVGTVVGHSQIFNPCYLTSHSISVTAEKRLNTRAWSHTINTPRGTIMHEKEIQVIEKINI